MPEQPLSVMLVGAGVDTVDLVLSQGSQGSTGRKSTQPNASGLGRHKRGTLYFSTIFAQRNQTMVLKPDGLGDLRVGFNEFSHASVDGSGEGEAGVDVGDERGGGPAAHDLVREEPLSRNLLGSFDA